MVDDDFWNPGKTPPAAAPVEQPIQPVAAPVPQQVAQPVQQATTAPQQQAAQPPTDTDQNFRSEEEEQQAGAVVAQLIQLVEQGQAIEQVMAGANLPEHLKDKVRRRLQEAQQQKEIREHQMAQETREKAGQGRGSGLMQKIFSIQMAAQLIPTPIMKRIEQLLAQRPDLQQQIAQVGQELNNLGVTPEMVRVSEQQLGQMASPSVGQGQGKEQEQGR